MNNKDKILNTSLELFIKEGFHGTSTSKIAEEAGVSNGTLFHHFKTKDILINALFDKIKEEFKAYLIENMGTPKTTKSRIRNCWYNCIKWSIENKNATFFFSMFASSPYIDKLSKQEAFKHHDFILKIIEDAIADETLLATDSKLILEFFKGSVHAYFNYYNDNPDKYDATVEIAFKMFWQSIVNI